MDIACIAKRTQKHNDLPDESSGMNDIQSI